MTYSQPGLVAKSGRFLRTTILLIAIMGSSVAGFELSDRKMSTPVGQMWGTVIESERPPSAY
jgi:hypothetical protein